MKKNIFKVITLILSLILVFSTGVSFKYAQANSFNKTAAKKNISVNYKKTSDGLIAIYKNKNSYPVKLKSVMKFRDANNKAIQVTKKYNICLGSKETCVIFYPAPYDNDGNYINYNNSNFPYLK